MVSSQMRCKLMRLFGRLEPGGDRKGSGLEAAGLVAMNRSLDSLHLPVFSRASLWRRNDFVVKAPAAVSNTYGTR